MVLLKKKDKEINRFKTYRNYGVITEAGHPDMTDLSIDFSRGNSDTMDILTLRFVLGLRLGRVLGCP